MTLALTIIEGASPLCRVVCPLEEFLSIGESKTYGLSQPTGKPRVPECVVGVAFDGLLEVSDRKLAILDSFFVMVQLAAKDSFIGVQSLRWHPPRGSSLLWVSCGVTAPNGRGKGGPGYQGRSFWTLSP